MSWKTTISLFSIILIICNCANTTPLSQSSGFGYELLSTALDQLQYDTNLNNETIHRALQQGCNRFLGLSRHCPATTVDGEYMLRPHMSTISPFRVYCEYGNYGGEEGSIVIHRRFDGRLSFDRTWSDYRNGFGSLQSEFWLGLEKMHQITRSSNFELTVVLKDAEGVEWSARYSRFSIGSEFDQYVLRLGNFLGGSLNDSLTTHNGKKFLTTDKTTRCTRHFQSGWWYDDCHHSNLNVPYENGTIVPRVTWSSLKNTTSFIKESRMIIKPIY